MDEIQKTEMRNYSMAAGFFIIAAQFLFLMIYGISGMSDAALTLIDEIYKVSAILLIIVGIILIVMKNRDLSAITFMMFGLLMLFMATTPEKSVSPIIIGVFMLILALVILTAKDKKKYLLFILPALVGITKILIAFSMPIAVYSILYGIIFVIALYFAFASAAERFNLPGGNLLKADVKTDFKSSGSVLGYLLFGMISAVWSCVYFLNVPSAAALALDIICGFMLIFLGILLWACGKMRFTPIMFMLTGFLIFIGQFLTGELFYGVGVMFIVIGLFAILRKESRILPGIMLISYGCVYFITVFITGAASFPILAGILNLIPCLISVYIAFAIFSQKKLPLF